MKNLFHFFVRRHENPWLQLVDWVVIILSIGIFTYAVLPNVINASAYFDEGYSAYLAKQDLLKMAYYTALDVHPPLYYAVLHFWQNVFGSDVAVLRTLGIIFGWIAIVFGFLVVKRTFGHRAAWVATILLALSPLFIRYGASMRMYTMALAIGLAATYILLIAVQSKRRWPWVVYAVLVAAGMWTNYFTALIWAAHLVWVLYEYRKDSRIKKATWWSLFGALLLYLPWLPALLFRAGEIQVSGFWIKPLSIDTLVSTITMSLTFRSATDTTGWLAVAVIAFVIITALLGRMIYSHLNREDRRHFTLIGGLASLPVILLAAASLPPLRPAYVFRYVLFASTAASLLIAIIICLARFKRHHQTKQVGLFLLTFGIFVIGAYQAMVIGNRNLDTNSQNKLAQVVHDMQQSGSPAPVVVRSPYSYYAVSLYNTANYHAKFLFYKGLDTGSTKPLYDHPEDSVKNFNELDKVWLVGEDRGSVVSPSGNWKIIDAYVEYDDITKKPAAFARLYEKID